MGGAFQEPSGIRPDFGAHSPETDAFLVDPRGPLREVLMSLIRPPLNRFHMNISGVLAISLLSKTWYMYVFSGDSG